MRAPSALTRDPRWPDLLAEIIQQRAATPFAWGLHDCALLAADVVLALTGTDPAGALRGAYSTEAEADALIAQHGGLEALAATLAAEVGLGDCAPTFAQRGDVALVTQGNMRALGVVVGDSVAVPAAQGLAFLPLASIQRAWSV